MKIVVCIKHVPDTGTRVKVSPDGVSLDETGVKMIISPFDEFALEEALLLREARGGGEVVLAAVGREAAQVSLRQGLAMGADRAVLLADERFDRADGLCRARALATIVRSESPELTFLGKCGFGADEGLTGPMLAEVLDLPHAASVSSLELREGFFIAHSEVEGAIEVLEGSLPGVVTWDKGQHEPRYASLKGIMAAKKKPLSVLGAGDLGFDPAELAARPRVEWESLELPPARKAGRIIPGPAGEAVKELVRLLREEAKVI